MADFLLVSPVGRLPSVARKLNERLVLNREDANAGVFEVSAFAWLLHIG